MIPVTSLSSLTAISSSLLAIYSSLAYATVLPAKRQFVKPPGFSLHTSGTGVRTANINHASTNGSTSSVTVNDLQDSLYTVDITIGGQDVTVQLDTGSADLWVYIPDTPPQLTNKTSVRVTETYGAGVASGPLAFAELKLGQYTIPYQAFLNADSIKDFGPDLKGILGMAFDTASIYQTITASYGPDAAAAYGKAPISNIFAQNPSQPNYFDVHLGRTSDLDNISDGTFTISEHVQGYEDVGNQAKLERLSPNYWSVTLDAMEVNGNAFAFNASSVSGVASGKIATVLDTGFTNPPLPAPAVDAIYSSIPGAVPYSGIWIVPCLGSTNLTFVFGGKPYPVHPLDLTETNVATYTQNGVEQNVTYCTNTYQYLTLDPSSFFGFDAILGDAFLRNVYATFDYGDYDPTTKTDGQPFVQLLSTTTQDAAYTEFQQARANALKSLPPLIDPAQLVKLDSGATADGGSGSVKTSGALSSDTTSSDSDLTSLVKKYGPLVVGLLAGNLLVGILLFFIGLAVCVKGVVRGGAKTRSVGAAYAPVSFKEDH